MYAQFYGLSESPFALTPDPRYLFLSDAHKEALASATYGVQERKGFVLILGEVGTGKTTLIRHLLGRFGPNIRTVFVFNPAVSFLELLQLVLRDLELPCPSVRRVEMIETLNEYLLKEAAEGRYVVLIIDEAQHLSPTVLEEVRMLSNLETARGKLIQILLVGQPELGEKLGRPELRQLRQRIGLVAELKPLSHQETVQYVTHRLDVAGYKGQQIFTRRALRIIHQASGGIPRLVNVICDKALLLAYGSESAKVKGRLIREVLKDWKSFRRRSLSSQRRSLTSDTRARARATLTHGIHSWKPFWRIAAVALIGVAATGSYLMMASPRDGGPLARLGGFLTAWTSGTVVAASKADGLPAPESPAKSVKADTRTVKASEQTAAPSVPALPPRVALRAEPLPLVVPEPPKPKARTVDATPQPAAATPAIPVKSPPGPTPAPSRDADSGTREVVVKQGDALSALVTRQYGRADLTLLDFVRSANPEVTSIDELSIGQRLKLPAFEPGALVERTNGSAFRVHVATVWETETPAYQKFRAALEASGRQVHVIPVSLTRSETAYRVMVGDFASRREAEAFTRTFRVPNVVTSQMWR
jgi:general secretion pathway protein A